MNSLKAFTNALINIGINPEQSTYEQGLVRLTNKAALIIPLMVNLIMLPLALINQLTLPILFINSLFYPIAILLNKFRKYTLARHYLLIVFYSLIVLVTLFHGRGSGVMFLSIPSVLLAIIFFYRRPGMISHLLAASVVILCTLYFHYNYPPLWPFSSKLLGFMYPFHLVISLVLTIFFFNFFYTLNQEYQRELMELNYTKNKIISIISHDLRSPFSSLKGVLSLLSNRTLSQDEFYSLAAYLQQKTENLSYMLDNLLQWALTQMRGFTPSPVDFSVYDIAEEQISIFSEAAAQKNIKLENTIPPSVRAYADPNHIRLVLRNLVNNAIKFTPEGGSIHLQATESGTHIIVSVRDTGIGIAEDFVKKLFSAEKKIPDKGTQGETGTGLGLMLCREMIEYNRGSLSVKSQPGEGSTFSFAIPQAAPAKNENMKEKNLSRNRSTHS